MPYTGYVAGQSISVAVEADNASNVEINAVVVKLNKVIFIAINLTFCYLMSQPEKGLGI